MRRAEPTARVGISVGGWLSRRRHRWNRRVVQCLFDAISSGRFDCLMAHHRLVDSGLVSRVTAAGGEVYAWTVDSEQIIERLTLTGVAGITTNDPRLFGGAGRGRCLALLVQPATAGPSWSSRHRGHPRR